MTPRTVRCVTAAFLAIAVLTGCGGSGFDSTTVLAEGERTGLAGQPARGSTVSETLRISAGIRGASSVEDFLSQSAEAVLQADENAFGFCEERRIEQRSERYDPFEDPILDVFKRNGAEEAWRTHILVGGCAPPRLHNLIIVTFEDRPSAFIPLLPGSTQADPALQKEAALAVYETAALASGVDCPGQALPRIRDTRHVDGLDTEQFWREVWTAHYCGRDYAVPLTFHPEEGRPTHVEADRANTARIDLDWPRL